MTLSALSILTIILSVVAVAATFIPRVPAAAIAYLGLLAAHFGGAIYVDSKVLIFWAVAVLLVLGLRMLQPEALVNTRAGHGYIAGATLAGTALGYLASATAASIILGGAIGAFLGAVAYMRTPASPRMPIASGQFMEYLCAKGLPSVVACAIAAISMGSIL